MISEPQRTYLLELFAVLGPAARHFVLVGAQAMKFVLPAARPTRDFAFVLDVAPLRALDVHVAQRLSSLGYEPIKNARYFQFRKPIPDSDDEMRIEFMGPESYRRKANIRVKVQKGLHARGCVGAEIALRESAFRKVEGQLPSGEPATAAILVTQPWALVMLKCLAMDDRYRNVRGAQEYEHDRNEAMIHAGDIVAMVSAQADAGFAEFRARFHHQFEGSRDLRVRVLDILGKYFVEDNGPGLLLYLELEARQSVSGEPTRDRALVERAQSLVAALVQPPLAGVLPRLAEGERP